jgi:signal transduction histidine kinase
MAVTQNNLLFNEPSAPLALDGPLPDEVVGSAGNALTRYRMYPVFSLPWFLGRLKVGMWLITAIAILNIVTIYLRLPHVSTASTVILGALFLLDLTLTVHLAPLLAVIARQRSRTRAWTYRREAWAIVCLLLLATLAQTQFKEWGQEYTYKIIDTPPIAAERASRRAAMAAKPFYVRASAEAVDYSLTFLLMFCIGGGIAAVSYFRERERLSQYEKSLQLRAAQEAKRETELRLSVLQAQVEPHFLFNTLASLRSLIAQDPPRASALLDKLVDYLRSTIPHTQADGTPVACTLGLQMEAAHSYLELMQMRMGAERLAFKVDCDEALRTQSFPPLMLITLVENAIKHGLEPLAAGGAVHINAHVNTQAKGTPLQSEQLVLSVADNGRGFGGAAVMGTGIGLANTRMRLQHLYGGKAQFELIPEARSDWLAALPTRSATARPGFTAVISVPMNS